jgi:predicted outer membrane lipoprotein
MHAGHLELAAVFGVVILFALSRMGKRDRERRP